MTIHNTSKFYRENPEVALMGAMGSRGIGGFIEDMEAIGQRELVNSDRLPTKLNGDTDADFEALGFVFGEPDKGDPMFRPATLPRGWGREGSDHAMWSYLVDQHGRRRVRIFYKAAFYDREAFMSLDSPRGYLTSCLWDKREPVLDDEWLPRDVAVAELAKIRDRRLEEAGDSAEYYQRQKDPYWKGREAEHRQEAAAAEAMRARVASA